jgi:hypothetical protein
MSTTLNKKKKVKTQPKGVTIYKQIPDDKSTISKHLQNGGTFKELLDYLINVHFWLS